MFFLHAVPLDEYITKHIYDQTVKEDTVAQFQCEVSDEDASVKWFVDGIEVFESKKYVFETQGRKRRLLIYDVSKQDEGSVAVTVGSDESVANLYVKGRSNFI